MIHGHPSESIFLANQTSIGFVESPRYPESYPRSVVKNYTLINDNRRGFVRLTFDDFHVHFQSQLKVTLTFHNFESFLEILMIQNFLRP